MAGDLKRNAVDELYAEVEDRKQELIQLGETFVSKGGQVFTRTAFERSAEELKEQVNQYEQILKQRLGG